MENDGKLTAILEASFANLNAAAVTRLLEDVGIANARLRAPRSSPAIRNCVPATGGAGSALLPETSTRSCHRTPQYERSHRTDGTQELMGRGSFTQIVLSEEDLRVGLWFVENVYIPDDGIAMVSIRAPELGALFKTPCD